MAFALAVKVRPSLDSAGPGPAGLVVPLKAATASQQLAAAVECLAFDGGRAEGIETQLQALRRDQGCTATHRRHVQHPDRCSLEA